MPVDFSPLYAPVPESPTSRGLTSVGTALDAVLARRQQRDLMEQQIEERKLTREMLDTRTRRGQDINAGIAGQRLKSQDEHFQQQQRLKEKRYRLSQSEAGTRIVGNLHKLVSEGGMTPEQADDYLDSLEEMGAQGPQPTPGQPGQGATPGATPPAGQPQAPQAPQTPPAPRPLTQQDLSAFGMPAPMPQTPADAVARAQLSPPPLAEAPAPTPPMAAAPAAPAPMAVGTPATAAAAPRRPRANFSASTPAAVADAWEQGKLATPEVLADPRLQDEVRSIAADGRKPNGLTKDQMAKLYDSAKNRISREKNADRMALMQRTTRSLGDEGKAITNEDRLQRMFREAVLTPLQYRAMASENAIMQSLGSYAPEASKNSAIAKIVRGRWARMGQGPGVLTDSDLKAFFDSINGVVGQLGMTWAQLTSGTLPQGVVDEIDRALVTLRQAATEKYKHFETATRDWVAGITDPVVRERALKAVPSWVKVYATMPGSRPASGGAPAPVSDPDEAEFEGKYGQ